MSRSTPVVIVVSDDPVLRELLRGLLERERIFAVEAPSADEALARCREEPRALLVVDAIVGGPDIATLLSRLSFLRLGREAPPVVLLTGSATDRELCRHEAIKAWIGAPFAAPELVGAVRQHLPGTSSSHTRLRAPSDEDEPSLPQSKAGSDES